MVGHFGNLREMFAHSQSRTVPVFLIGGDVVVGWHRQRVAELLRAHGLIS